MAKGPFTELLAPNIRLWMAIAEDDKEAQDKAVKRLARARYLPPPLWCRQPMPLSWTAKLKRHALIIAPCKAAVRVMSLWCWLMASFCSARLTGPRPKSSTIFMMNAILSIRTSMRGQRVCLMPLRRWNAKPGVGLAEAFGAIGEAMNSENRTELALGYYRVAHYLNRGDDNHV